eukprot:Skav209869  [mRNA]  locus=scaffold590:89346:92049:+ [translate_table: standard]
MRGRSGRIDGSWRCQQNHHVKKHAMRFSRGWCSDNLKCLLDGHATEPGEMPTDGFVPQLGRHQPAAKTPHQRLSRVACLAPEAENCCHEQRSADHGVVALDPAVLSQKLRGDAVRQTAAELLFGSAPFQVHPHRVKAFREDVLVVFASALLKKMMQAWMNKAHVRAETELVTGRKHAQCRRDRKLFSGNVERPGLLRISPGKATFEKLRL